MKPLLRQVICLFGIGLVGFAVLDAADSEPGNKKPSNLSNIPRAELRLDKDYMVRRSEIVNDNGALLCWVIKRDGQVVLKRNARRENVYQYFGRWPGTYTIHLELFVDGKYRVISNEVSYELTDKNARAIPEKSPKANLGKSTLTNIPGAERFLGDAIINAITSGDLAAFKKALADGADVNYRREKLTSTTPLTWAIEKYWGDTNRLAMINELLRRGADVNLPGRGGETALMVALDHSPDALIQQLLSLGADPLPVSNDGRSALFAACKRGAPDLAIKFLKMGAQVKVESNRKETPLLLLLDSWVLRFHTFAEDEFVPLVQLLLDKGVDPEVRRGMDNKTAADMAFEHGLAKLLKLLDVSRKYQKDYERLDRESPLRRMGAAIEYKRSDLVERYLRDGVSPNENHPRYRTSFLSLATSGGDLKTVQLLLKHGAAPNRAESGLNTPLAAAVKSLDILQLLLSKGANPNGKHPETGETALHQAAREACPRSIELLIARGANVHAETAAKLTPLDYAILQSEPKLESLTLLLKHGANPNHGARTGCTPLMSAVVGGTLQHATVLLQHGAKPDLAGDGQITPLILAAMSGKLDMAKFLVERGANTRLKDKNGKAAADYAAELLLIPVLRVVDKDGSYAKLIEEFTPAHSSPLIGAWAYRKQGFGSFGFALNADGAGILGTDFGAQGFLWKETRDKLVLFFRDERGGGYRESMSFEKTADPTKLLLRREGTETMLVKQPAQK